MSHNPAQDSCDPVQKAMLTLLNTEHSPRPRKAMKEQEQEKKLN